MQLKLIKVTQGTASHGYDLSLFYADEEHYAVGYKALGHKHVVPAMILYIYIYIFHSICVSIWLFVSTPCVEYCILINPLLLFAVIFHKSKAHLLNGYLYDSGFFVYQNRIFSFYEFVAYSP